jgi:hypothetical protein
VRGRVPAVHRDDVVALAAERFVACAGASLDRVVPGLSVDAIGADTAQDVVAGSTSADDVVAILGLDCVPPERANDHVWAVGACEPAGVALRVVNGGLKAIACRHDRSRRVRGRCQGGERDGG